MLKFNFSSIAHASLIRRKSLLSDLIGSASMFPLETRIFHSISLGLIILCTVYIPYNLFEGLYIGSFSACLFALFYSQQYYSSRFQGKKHSNTLFGITGIVIFSVNYFANSGINGSTDLIWPVYLLLVLAISPYDQHLKWVILYLLCFLGVHVIEFFHPYLVKYPFTAGKGQFIDRVTAFPLPVIAIYIIIKFLRRSYDREKVAAEERALAVELSKEQILLHKDQLEKSNIEKNKLMSIISHDLRTPLTNVRQYLELLSHDGLSAAERQELEQYLLKSTNNAIGMLSNLLHWTKSQMEGPSVSLAEVNLLTVLMATLEMEKMHAAKKDITLESEIPSGLTVIADADMLQLVVRNLISNAIKFTPAGGQIRVNAQVQEEECMITVSDNGEGISSEKQETIFTIRAEPAFGTNNERGVGLGLVLCKEFTERQGGRIGFESTAGMGSSFFIILPPKLIIPVSA
jgi:two-component system sensor histidine kinase/response regulator